MPCCRRNQVGADSAERVVIELESRGDIGSVVDHHDIHVGDEFVHDGLRLRVAQRQHQRALAAIERLEPLRFARHELRELPPGFAFRRLDLDHLCAHVGQVLTTERSGDDLREFEHADTAQRSAVGCAIVRGGHGRYPFALARCAAPTDSRAVAADEAS